MHLGLKSVTASNQLTEAQMWIIEKALEAPLPDGWTVGTGCMRDAVACVTPAAPVWMRGRGRMGY